MEQSKVKVKVLANKDTLGRAAADYVATTVQAAIERQDYARVIFATGASQYEFLDALVQLKTVDWSKVTAFHLDEYIGIPADHPASFRRYLKERLFDRLTFGAVHLLDGMVSDLETTCRAYGALLAEQPIDLACIGIGENAHLAFNDPPADFETDALVHVVTLDDACRQQQVGEGHFPSVADVPQQALSLSIPAILQARSISCAVPDARKAAAVRCALEGPIVPECPASALRTHTDCHLFLDAQSASQLSDS